MLAGDIPLDRVVLNLAEDHWELDIGFFVVSSGLKTWHS